MSQAKKIIKNFTWLTIAELATKGISFFTNAYLARVILAEGYGKINFAIATVTYFITFVTLGLNVIGAREVARNPERKSFYVETILSIRVLVCLLSFAIYFSFIFINNFSPSQTQILIIASIYILSATFLIDWYYQGLEKMEILAVRQFLIASLNLIGIMLFVRSSQDSTIAIIIMASSTLINTLFLLVPYLKETKRLKFNFNLNILKSFIKEAIPISLTQVFLVFLSSSSIILIGLVIPSPDTKLGIYTAANKLMVLLFLPITVIQIVFYPYFSKSDRIDDRQKAYRKYITFNIIIGVFLSTFFFLHADIAINIVYGSNYTSSILLFKIMMAIVLMSYISQTAIHPLIAWKKEKKVFKIIFISSIFNVILNILLISQYELLGAIVANILTELFLMAFFIRLIRSIVKKYPFDVIIKIILVGFVASFVSYFILKYTNYLILSIIASIITYFFIILALKIITIDEIKGYLKK